ncbi:S41 family peptidase [uncultured Prevotella sp.]|mgnify:FL=1|uniref:S41 family peptidase n=1 Tax=uncultured Prevotella sp. TaxID=159272 RepID=UPI0025DD2CCD|nr:S41 family peptidase [uncultured Prevotella sp.]
MKNKILLLLFGMFAFAADVAAADTSRYVEFARTYGIVRYFSPNPYTQDWSESDWMKVCALLADRAETQPLETVFKSLAPTMSLTAVPVSSGDNGICPGSRAMYYSYSGSGELNVPFLAKLLMPGLADYIPYYKKLLTVSGSTDTAAVPSACRYYSYPVGEGKYLNVQHALPEDKFDRKATRRLLTDAKDYWKNHQIDDKALLKRRRLIFGLLSDKAVRVADVTVRWNIVRHFYPYYEEDRLDWDNRLERYMQKAVQMAGVNTFESLVEWYDTLCRFMNPVKDGHMFVRRDMNVSGIMSTYLPEFYAEAETKVVNDTLLVRMGTDGKQPWRILNAVNGQQASERLRYCRQITNAATEVHRDKMAAEKMLSSAEYGTPFVIQTVDASGQTHEDTLYAQSQNIKNADKERQPVRKLENGILYVDATSRELNEKLFLSALTPDVRGLCFDLRGLPTYQFEDILVHLIAADAKAPATEVAINNFPYQQNVTWRIDSETLKARQPHIALPATFLCDGATVSWGETILMMVRHYKLGKIAGQTTAGTTGDMTQFLLPLFPFSMTGMLMRCMDGEPHHARGIKPDITIPVYATDYINGYDRILNVALGMDE